MKILISITVLVLLFGCSNTITDNQIKAAICACEAHAGMYKMDDTYVWCNDNTCMWLTDAREQCYSKSTKEKD